MSVTNIDGFMSIVALVKHITHFDLCIYYFRIYFFIKLPNRTVNHLILNLYFEEVWYFVFTDMFLFVNRKKLQYAYNTMELCLVYGCIS